MDPKRASDVTTKSELINNIDITNLMFVNCNILNKTRKGSCWRKPHSLKVVFWKHLLWASLVGTDPGFLCTEQAQIWDRSYQIQQDVHPSVYTLLCTCASMHVGSVFVCADVGVYACLRFPWDRADWQLYPWLSWRWWWMCFWLPRRLLFKHSLCMHNIVLA